MHGDAAIDGQPPQRKPTGHPWLARWCPGSLRGHIAIVTAALFLAVGFIITLVNTSRLRADMAQVLSQQQLAATRFFARDMSGKLSLRLDALERVADNVPPALLADPPALQRWLEERLAIRILFPTGLMVIPPDGGPVLAQTPILPTRPRSFADRDWFIGAIASRRPYFSKPLVTRATAEPALVGAVPVYDRAGKLLAVVAGITPLRTQGFLDHITEARPGQSGVYELLSLRYGVYVIASDPAETLQPLPKPGVDPIYDRIAAGERGVMTGRNAAGVEELAVSVDIPHVDWVLVSRLPTAEVFAPVRNSIRNTVLMAAASAIPLLLLLLVVLNWLMRPLERLAGQLEGMAEGQRPLEPVVEPRHRREIAAVVRAFNRLQSKLLAQERRLAALARRDPLTGLANREPLNERLTHELQRQPRNGKALALLFLDLDGFKAVNDTYGHAVGDRLLCEVAHRLTACVRETDMVARLGGDEFIILLAEMDNAQPAAERVAQACLAAIAAPFWFAGQEIHVGVSIGIACLDDGDEHGAPESGANLMRRADAAMYEAKQSGRNRYRVAPPAPAHPLPPTAAI